MKINLISIGKKMPSWVNEGFKDYQKRLPTDYQLILHEVSTKKRNKNTAIAKLTQEESDKLLSKAPERNIIIALDRQGKSFPTETLAKKLENWHAESQDVSILIGGPEGISSASLTKCHETWSLSKLILPHTITRIVIAEQLYRAWSILQNHPYHRPT